MRRRSGSGRDRGLPAAGLTAVLLLVLARLATPGDAPPLFDGLGLGNEPYRYVQAPPGHKATPPPTTVSRVVKIEGGTSAPFDVSTSEMYPQASITAGSGALAVRAGSAASVVVKVHPIRPTGPPPAGYVYDGNVYRFTARTSRGRPVALASGAVVRIAFRGTGKRGKPSIALHAAHRWHVSPAPPTGVSAQYSTTISSLGDGVLVVPAGAASAPASSGIPALAVVGAICVAVILGLLVALRVVRARRPEQT